MSRLVLKGHATRGKEVINLLEMLGANRLGYKDTFVGFYYYIECGAIHSSDEYPTYSTIFTLEEFEEKFPYKVGDKVCYQPNLQIDTICVSEIISMKWVDNSVIYFTSNGHSLYACDLQPYKEETMEDKDIIEHTTEINLNHPCFDGHNKIELIIPENWKFEQRGNKIFGIRKYPQYPKTYGECCDILGYEPDEDEINCYKGGFIKSFVRLLICRDAYWKIAGNWRPEFRFGKKKYCIMTKDNKVISATVEETNRILAFPTEEMREVFYDAFEELINEVKELL